MPGLLAHQWYRTGHLLICQPQIHLTDFKVESPLDENYRNGILKVKVQFTNESGQNSPFVVGYRLLDKNDQQIAQSSISQR